MVRTPDISALRTLHRLIRRLQQPWQIELHRRAMTRFTVQRYVAIRLPDEPIDLRQPKPRTVTHVLGGKERFEHMLQDLLRHTDTGVGHRDQHILASSNAIV